MIPPRSTHSATKRAPFLVWAAAAVLALIGLAGAARRFIVLLNPPAPNPRFPAAAALDRAFASHRPLALMHMLPALLFMVLMPLQFVARIRERHIALHRWSAVCYSCSVLSLVRPLWS